MKYGYMDAPRKDAKSAPLLSRDGLSDYVMEFQAFAGLPQTGELDQVTVELMNTPRCGVKDVVGKGATARKKRYALQGVMRIIDWISALFVFVCYRLKVEGEELDL